MRILTSVAAMTLAAGVLAGCGGSDSEDPEATESAAAGSYCEELESAATLFGDSEASDLSSDEQMEQTLEATGTLAEEAPEEVAEDWAAIDDAFRTVDQALDDAGLDPSQLAELQSGQQPSDIDQEALTELATTLQSLDNEALTTSLQSVQDHAAAECDVEFGPTPTPTP